MKTIGYYLGLLAGLVVLLALNACVYWTSKEGFGFGTSEAEKREEQERKDREKFGIQEKELRWTTNGWQYQ